MCAFRHVSVHVFASQRRSVSMNVVACSCELHRVSCSWCRVFVRDAPHLYWCVYSQRMSHSENTPKNQHSMFFFFFLSPVTLVCTFFELFFLFGNSSYFCCMSNEKRKKKKRSPYVDHPCRPETHCWARTRLAKPEEPQEQSLRNRRRDGILLRLTHEDARSHPHGSQRLCAQIMLAGAPINYTTYFRVLVFAVALGELSPNHRRQKRTSSARAAPL